MKKKWIIALGALVLSAGVVYSFYRPSEAEKEELIVQLVASGLQQAHFAPQAFNDDFSERMFDMYLKSLDPGKRFFLASDVEVWQHYGNQLDDAVLSANSDFFNSTYETLMLRIGQAKDIYRDILNEPFDFSAEEYIETDSDDMPYAETRDDLREYWRQYLKYRTLLRVDDLLERKRDSLTLEEIESRAREKVLKSHEDWFDRMDEMERKDWHSVYINAITAVFDPHTQYFPPYHQDAFEIQMSGQLEGIGAQLMSKDGIVEVTRIVSGSASWRQGELKVGDQILKVAQADEEAVDVVDMRIEDVVQLIRGEKGTEVRLTIRKLNGTIKEIAIVRDVVVLEEIFARSAVIEKDGQKFGYIRLPKFYLSFDGSGRNCGEDVKNELIKLKKEGVGGVVVDLRNNGGGSLQGAIDIAGLFIDKGPVVQVKAKGQRPVVLNDENSGSVYDGPLVVMVNAFSASASEILAGALQDYERAVVVGATHTFGKGTVQNMFEFDEMVRGNADALKPLGALKLTIQKFYRIDGTTTQLRGVTPDIVLPNTYNLLAFGEKELEFPLQWDEIAPASYDRVGSVTARLEQLGENSRKRLKKNKTFELISEEASWLEQQDTFSRFPLQLERYRSLLDEWEATSERFEAIDEYEANYAVRELVMTEIERDTLQVEKTRRFEKNLNKDIELEEALMILNDLN